MLGIGFFANFILDSQFTIGYVFSLVAETVSVCVSCSEILKREPHRFNESGKNRSDFFEREMKLLVVLC